MIEWVFGLGVGCILLIIFAIFTLKRICELISVIERYEKFNKRNEEMKRTFIDSLSNLVSAISVKCEEMEEEQKDQYFNNMISNKMESVSKNVANLMKLCSFSIKKNVEAGKQLNSYDEFYNSTIEDVDEIVNYIDVLMKREMISLDPDIQNIRKAMEILRNILGDYGNENNKKEKSRIKKK